MEIIIRVEGAKSIEEVLEAFKKGNPAFEKVSEAEEKPRHKGWPGYAWELNRLHTHWFAGSPGEALSINDRSEDAKKESLIDQDFSETREDAELVMQHKIAKEKLAKAIWEENEKDRYWMDWENIDQSKWHFNYHHSSDEVGMNAMYTVQEQPSWMYCRTLDGLDRILEKLGEETVKMAIAPI